MDRDAYPDDMARFRRLNDEDVERLLRGLPPRDDEGLRDLASFLADATASLSVPPRSEIEAGHLAQVAEVIGSRSAAERRSTNLPSSPSERRRATLRRAARSTAAVVAAAASIVLLTGALALAGVDLPGTAAEAAFRNVLGVELPNQHRADAVDPAKLPARASDTAHRVLTVIHDWFEGADWSGCEFGAPVSGAARGLEGRPDTAHCGRSEHAGQGPQGRGAGASGTHGNGRETAAEASGGASSHSEAAGSRADDAHDAGDDGGSVATDASS